MKNKATINELAREFYAETKEYYFGNITPLERLSQSLQIVGRVMDEISAVNLGTVSALARMTAHYSATSRDADKDEVVRLITGRGGVFPLLERLHSDSEAVGVWTLFFETLSEAVDEAAK